MRKISLTNIAVSILIAINTLLFAVAVHFSSVFNILNLNGQYVANVFMDFIGIGVCLILLFSGIIKASKDKSDMLFIMIVFSEGYTLFLDICSWLFQGQPEYAFWNQGVNFLFYLSAVLIPVIFWFYQIEVMHLKNENTSRMSKIVLGIFFISLVALILNNFFGFYFVVDVKTGLYHRTDYFFFSMIPSYALFFISMYYVITKKTNWQIKVSFILVNLAPYIGGTVQMISYGLSSAYIGMLFAIITMYVNIQVDLRRKLENARTQLLLGQIKPHFISENLSVIKELFETRPEEAKNELWKISRYIQENIAVMEDSSLISFNEELGHIKLYAEIELRSLNNIKIEYDIKDSDYLIPALSVQPLVENAIKHGLARRNQGTIKIKSYLSEKCHVIEVYDDGIGFNTEKTALSLESGAFGENIGLKNVQDRILNLCGGSMSVKSVPYEFTVVTIQIPVKNPI